jgi:hypothetical protein
MMLTPSRMKTGTMMYGLPVNPPLRGVISIRQMSRLEMVTRGQQGAPDPMYRRYRHKHRGRNVTKKKSIPQRYHHVAVLHRQVFRRYSLNGAALCRPTM